RIRIPPKQCMGIRTDDAFVFGRRKHRCIECSIYGQCTVVMHLQSYKTCKRGCLINMRRPFLIVGIVEVHVFREMPKDKVPPTCVWREYASGCSAPLPISSVPINAPSSNSNGQLRYH